MSNALTTIKDSLARARTTIKNAREESKMVVAEVASTTVGALTSAGLGALDQWKGTADADGLKYHSIGPVPTCAVVGLGGKVLAFVAGIDSLEGRLVNAVGQSGVNVGSYIGGQKLYLKMAAK